MNKAEILELAARVEALEGANGADRELHCLIFKAIGAPVPFQFASKFIALTFVEKEQAYLVELGDGMRIRYEPPNYTSSIDAAMGLVPEGWSVATYLSEKGNYPIVKLGRSYPTNANVNQEGSTLPCTIAAAALRAIASTMEDDRG